MINFEVSARTVHQVQSQKLRRVDSNKVNDEREVDWSNYGENTQSSVI